MAQRKPQAEFTKWFGPLLDALRDLGGSGKPKEVSTKIAENLKLPNKFLEESMKSGALRFHNQVAWARQYLVWEGLLDSSKFGTWSLTPKGFKTKIKIDEAHKIFLKWVEIHQNIRKNKNSHELITDLEESEPEDVETTTSHDLLEVLKNLTSEGFEQICAKLLRESDFENVVVTGRSHDGGIDGFGTLQVNPFVSFKVLFQCKRYRGTVSRKDVGDFRNAMLGRAEKGIIMTTGSFSNDAIKEASRDGAPKIELVDGEKLVEMFKKAELGMIPKTIYEVDIRFFEQYMKN
jgi:restriction system protein